MGDTAASWLKEWNTVKADCLKRIGKKGKFPKPKTDPSVTLTKATAAAKALEADAKKFLKSIKDYQTLLTDVEGDAYDFAAVIEKNEFNLSKANVDEEKIINKVRYELGKCLTGIQQGSKSPRQVAGKLRDALESGESLSDF